MVDNTVKNNTLDFRATNGRICILWFKTRFFNVSSINAYAQTEDKDNEYITKCWEKYTTTFQVMT